MRGARVLVTGGAGFIGSHLTDQLVAQGAAVTVYDNLSAGDEAFLAGALRAGATLVQADLLDLQRLARAVAGQQMVWHLAANSDIRRGTRSTRLDLNQGTLATHNVLEAMRLGGVRRLAFASSSVVYGEPARIPTPEDYGPLQPISYYGAAKLAAEGLVTAAAHCQGLQAYIFRFANVVGPRATHGILRDFAGKLRRRPGELEVLGDGRQEKSYLAVADCVAAMLHVVRHADKPVNLYNLGSGDTLTVARIAELALARWGAPGARLRFAGGPRGWPGDVPRMQLSVARLAALGFAGARPSEQAVVEAMEAI